MSYKSFIVENDFSIDTGRKCELVISQKVLFTVPTAKYVNGENIEIGKS